jgi:hypothetical protein
MEIPNLCLEEILVERQNLNILSDNSDLLDAIPTCLRATDERDLRLRWENMQDLKTLQKIILEEEDRVLSLDEVLSRVLSFYRRFVQYR